MFNSRRITELEKEIDCLYDIVSRQNEDLEMLLKDFYEPVSPAKAPKKRGRPAKKVTTKKK